MPGFRSNEHWSQQQLHDSQRKSIWAAGQQQEFNSLPVSVLTSCITIGTSFNITRDSASYSKMEKNMVRRTGRYSGGRMLKAV